MIRAVLFDLDGTLADTARDLGWALNALLAEHGLPPQPYEAMRPIASHGARGPAFLVLKNFDAIYSYNAAESYGLAIAHLADRLRGGGPFVTPWPTDDAGLSRAERRELQQLLAGRGHDIGTIDGLLGERSRAAIRAERQRLFGERTPDGRAGQKLLRTLRAEALLPATDSAAPASPDMPISQ